MSTVSDLAAHQDTELLTAEEIAAWLGTSAKAVRRMQLTPVSLLTRPRRYLAGHVKAVLLKGVPTAATASTPAERPVLAFTPGRGRRRHAG